jgi:hypothetical protein
MCVWRWSKEKEREKEKELLLHYGYCYGIYILLHDRACARGARVRVRLVSDPFVGNRLQRKTRTRTYVRASVRA